MADVFVGPIIEKLIEIGFEYLKDQIRWQKGMKEELERLQKNHPHIQAIVDYASSLEDIKDKKSALNIWLWQLRDAIDEAEDVMEELEYQKLMEKTKKGKFGSFLENTSKVFERVIKNDPTLKRLEEVVHKLDQVSADVTTFLQLAKEAKLEHQVQNLELNRARDMGPLPKNVPIGRDNEKEFVMNWLRKTSNENQTTLYSNISLLSIVGHGGMGKTTLLQEVYNEFDEKEFDLKFWACVSNDFDKNTVIKKILEFVTMDGHSMETFGALQQKLRLTVNSKKFLLVLDDIWEGKEEDNKEMNKSEWEDVLAPLAYGKLGSKILITTRMDSVAVMLSEIINNEEEKLILEGLNDDECLQLLYKHAFKKGEGHTAYQNLLPIAEKIVKKLSGSPLAAKVIGGVLSSSLDETHWNRVLNYKIGSQKPILDILKLSYIFLPKVLQGCFSFCCTFPQDYEFDKDDLVRMWIALGFIQPDKTRRETMKDAGERYFDTLVQKSLFDEFQARKKYRYKLHDLLHEMLRNFSTQECLSIVGGQEELLSKTSKTVRHLFLKHVNSIELRKVEEFKHLRSFILINPNGDKDLGVILAKIFKNLSSIRLIYIRVFMGSIKKIPKEIEDLIHLQYVKIHCQYVMLKQVYLPAFWRLPFLKYLFLSHMPGVKGFDYKFHGNRKVRGFPSLQVLHIKKMEALEDWFVAKAYECLFPCLTELHLEKCPNLLELPAGLPLKLEKLKIIFIRWKSFKWLQDISTNYCSIYIIACPKLRFLEGHQEIDQTTGECQLILSELHIADPSMLLKGPLASVTSIRVLSIDDNDKVISFSKDDFEEWFLKVSSSLCVLTFYSLKSLQCLPSFLESLSSLKELFVSDIPMLQLLPKMPASLKELVLSRLPQLQDLPDLPPSVEILKIEFCHPELMKRYKKDTGSDRHKIAHIPKVEIIDIDDIFLASLG